MATNLPKSTSNRYEEFAERFMASRNPHIGAATVGAWSATLQRGATILELGCGNGVPISQVLIDNGFAIHAIDTSSKMVAAFGKRFPGVHTELADVANSNFFDRTFDAAIAWGLMFLLPADVQVIVIGKVARALNRGGKFVFTAPREAVAWLDVLTGLESISLGSEMYRQIVRAEGLVLSGEQSDEGGNHYYLVSKP